MSKQGVALGRGGAPSFRAVLPGITIVRNTAGNYSTGTGYGLYGSTSYVRAAVVTILPPYDASANVMWRTSPTGTGWLFQVNGQGYRFRHFDTTATARPPNIIGIPFWPLLAVLVFTYDGVNARGYLNGVLQYTTAVANIDPASAGATTMEIINNSDSMWCAHLLGSDAIGAFLDDAEVLAWSSSVSLALRMRQQIVPWTDCSHWWNAADCGAQTWRDRISLVVATSNNPGRVVRRSLPVSSVPRI